MEKNADGRLAITRVTLRPQVEFDPKNLPTPEQIKTFHHEAHETCFIANSVRTEVNVEPR